MPSLTAASCVFNTAELVELILLHIPPRERLTSLTRVSRKFRSVVLNSQALFFRPDATIPPTKWILNPLLRDKFKLWFIHYDCPQDLPSVPRISADIIGHVGDPKRDSFLHPDASWRRMLVIQPPPKFLTITNFSCPWEEPLSSASQALLSFDDEEAGGVTMGSIYDISVSISFFYLNAQFGLFVQNQDGKAPNITLALYTGPRRKEGSDNHSRIREDPNSIRSKAEKRWECGDRVKLEPLEEMVVVPWVRNDLTPERGAFSIEEYVTRRIAEHQKNR